MAHSGPLFTEKKAHTDQYLHFQSHHPLHHKEGVIRTLIDRADALVSEPEDRKAEVEHVTKALKLCGYPQGIIGGVIRRRQLVQATKTVPKRNLKKSRDTDYRAKSMVVIPYVKGLSEKTRRIFKRHGIHCALKPANTLRSLLVRPKDPRPKLDTSQCVYRIPCANCDKVYVGETGRHLKCRIKEHQESVKKVSKHKYTRARSSTLSTDTVNPNALADHVAQHNHCIDWDQIGVLAQRCDNQKGRWIREAIKVRAEPKDTMNRDEGNYKLSRTWDALLMSGGIPK